MGGFKRQKIHISWEIFAFLMVHTRESLFQPDLHLKSTQGTLHEDLCHQVSFGPTKAQGALWWK